MLDKKGFWYFLMFGAIVLWVAVIWLGYVIFPHSAVGKAVPFVLTLMLHLSEIPISSKIGRAKGVPRARVIILTAIFGFTWWLPLKRGVIS
ncbi:MAG: hypothetical protein JRC86_04245 [Deltaproteobacteria bacterium]|nr:hypothetical protein [Deltaproteobacteria bacterium]